MRGFGTHIWCPDPVSLCTLLPIFPASIYQESIFRLAILWSFHVGERTHGPCPFLSRLSQLRSPRATRSIAVCIHTVSTFSLSFICPWTLGWLHNLAPVTGIAANMGEETSLPYADFVPFGCAPRCGLTGLCGRPSFSVLRSLSTWSSILTVSVPIFFPSLPAFAVLCLVLIASRRLISSRFPRSERTSAYFELKASLTRFYREINDWILYSLNTRALIWAEYFKGLEIKVWSLETTGNV